MTGLQSLGDPNAVVCDGDVCYLPGADANLSGRVESVDASAATAGSVSEGGTIPGR